VLTGKDGFEDEITKARHAVSNTVVRRLSSLGPLFFLINWRVSMRITAPLLSASTS